MLAIKTGKKSSGYSSIFYQLARNVWESTLLQLGLPERQIRIVEPVLGRPVFLHMVQGSITIRESVPMRRSQDAPGF
ncbi:uncharacterized protein BP5553_10581 [Venustampulla echinocandica]|uniref:Uncharacterized protein n=1 Tax=Venustampulla echinocandica TaxID=2656787 RepID=A0A370T8Y1_9HELO|nr:uncharacterized protein BP5553_10581 [Venustampulla echinocandica]RDL29954.1 hypothetical protein BP5553_10581 [Venustampulla echinocandica]